MQHHVNFNKSGFDFSLISTFKPFAPKTTFLTSLKTSGNPSEYIKKSNCNIGDEPPGYLAGICLFKPSNGNTLKMYAICSMLTIKTPERHHWRCFGVFIVNFEQISRIVLVFLLFTLNKQ